MRGLVAVAWIVTSVLLCAVMWPVNAEAVQAESGPSVTIAKGKFATFSVQGSLGVLDGEAYEIVYDYSLGYQYKLSELRWDMKNVVMGGVVFSLGLADRVHANLGMWQSLAGGSGNMDDYDWLYPGYDWSHWSHHSVSVDGDIFDINAGVDLINNNGFALEAMIGYKTMSWSWDDKLLNYTYTINSFRDTYMPGDNEPSISYKQEFTIPYIGLSAKISGADAGARVYIIYSGTVDAEDNDFHIRRDLHFKDTFSNAEYIGMGISGYVMLNDVWYLTASYSAQEISKTVGDMEVWSSDGSYYDFETDAAGISNASTMFSFGVGATF